METSGEAPLHRAARDLQGQISVHVSYRMDCMHNARIEPHYWLRLLYKVWSKVNIPFFFLPGSRGS